jgi:hypothetical protein
MKILVFYLKKLLLRSLNSDMRWSEREFISRGNPHLTSRIFRVELGQTLNSKSVFWCKVGILRCCMPKIAIELRILVKLEATLNGKLCSANIEGDNFFFFLTNEGDKLLLL